MSESKTKKPNYVRSIYLPEFAELERIAVAETAIRGKPVQTGSLIREAVQSFMKRYWKSAGRT